ncbi:MAG: PDGLE domain-containing protein [Zestosphaera sp.]
MFSRKTLLTLLVLLVLSPLFGVFLAEELGYHEPLDLVAEELGLNESEFTWTPLKEYTVPGLPDWLGYIVCGVLGVLIIILAGFVMKTMIRR